MTHVKVGDLVGVGAQNDSCRDCVQCKAHREPYCDEGQVGTYNGVYKRGAGKGDKSFGGYSDYHRAPAHFVVKIPDGVDPALAAPMLCGGVTVYSPLTQYRAGQEGVKDVGIVGIGGLGHFGLLFASALGANVTAISHSTSKEADARRMGASNFIATHDGDEAFTPHRRSLDLIISTTNDVNMPIQQYLSLLRPGGHFVMVGAPESDLPTLSPFQFLMNNVHLSGSAIGSPNVIREMLGIASKHKVEPWIIKRPLEDVNQVSCACSLDRLLARCANPRLFP